MAKNINKLVAEAHQNAISKGWWEEERSFGEIIALVHSEVSEALEDFRNRKRIDEVWYEYIGADGRVYKSDKQKASYDKPCGIPSELADICIRIFDIVGKYGWGEKLEQEYEITEVNWEVDEEETFAENLTIIHVNLSQSFTSLGDRYKVSNLADAIRNVEKLAGFYKIDLDQAITEKMAYNATRPHKHGGKVI